MESSVRKEFFDQLRTNRFFARTVFDDELDSIRAWNTPIMEESPRTSRVSFKNVAGLLLVFVILIVLFWPGLLPAIAKMISD